MMSVDRCVCCGEPIPEGRMVCMACEHKAEEAENGKTEKNDETEETVKKPEYPCMLQKNPEDSPKKPGRPERVEIILPKEKERSLGVRALKNALGLTAILDFFMETFRGLMKGDFSYTGLLSSIFFALALSLLFCIIFNWENIIGDVLGHMLSKEILSVESVSCSLENEEITETTLTCLHYSEDGSASRHNFKLKVCLDSKDTGIYIDLFNMTAHCPGAK